MLRKILVTGCAALLMAVPAIGQELDEIGGGDSNIENSDHQLVVITPNGFFPQITYVVEGEKVKFYNQAEASRTVVAVTDIDGDGVPDMDDPQWELSTMSHGSYKTLTVTSAMILEFETLEGAELVASFSFDPPPSEVGGDVVLIDTQ